MKSDKINKILRLLSPTPEPLPMEAIILIKTFLTYGIANNELKNSLTELMEAKDETKN